MNGNKVRTIGEIVNENFTTTGLFNNKEIEVITKPPWEIRQRHLECNTERIPGAEISSKELDRLIDYILNNHHYYIWVNIPVIKEFSLKVARAEGIRFPATVEANRLFKELASKLEDHLREKEYELFPLIKYLVNAKNEGESISIESIAQLLHTADLEHQQMATKLKGIINLLTTLRICHVPDTLAGVLLSKLQKFQKDLVQHIQLENDVLFPKALKLEAELKKSRS